MVLQVVWTLASYVFRPGYYTHAAIGIASIVVTYAFAQGRTTNRERDLHARTILLTGAFTPLGLTLISNLAARGAKIIALCPYHLEHPEPTLLIPALRAATNNENIFVEHADLSSPASIRDFCTRFLTGEDQRVDAIIYAHEYRGIGSLFAKSEAQEEKRVAGSLATFLMTTLLLPVLLVAPLERDIRIIHVVNPFYAAAIPAFTSTLVGSMSQPEAAAKLRQRSVFIAEGNRALRTTVLARHLQRILNALPNRAPTFDQAGPKPNSSTVPLPAMPEASPPTDPATKAPSNIVSISVCPGMSRGETVRPLLGAEREFDPDGASTIGHILYYTLFIFIWLFAKGSTMSIQSILHVLFLPTPFKRALAHALASADPSGAPTKAKTDDDDDDALSPSPSTPSTKNTRLRTEDLFTEVVKPGALYRECSVIPLTIPPLPPADNDKAASSSSDKKGKKTGKAEEDLVIEDDGEFGGESLGRVVWEWFEQSLKAWEAEEKRKAPEKTQTEIEPEVRSTAESKASS